MPDTNEDLTSREKKLVLDLIAERTSNRRWTWIKRTTIFAGIGLFLLVVYGVFAVKKLGYHKCGVQFSHIQPASVPNQLDLFDFANQSLPSDSPQLMKTLDQINRLFPKAISIAATGFEKSWKSKAERISQRYTTDWRELLTVKC